MSDDKKKFSELVRAERAKGNVVYLCIDEVLSAPVKEIIKQPAEGLLWDLNRDEVTALSFMDKEGMIHWVNNFAVALVIKELKRQLDEALTEHDALKREVLLLNAQLIHAKAHDCTASTAGEWGEAYTWDSLSEEMRNHWIQQALLTAEEQEGK